MWNQGVAENLSRRERQVMELLIQSGGATAREVEQVLPNAPTYSAVRSILRILVGKGLVIKKQEEGRDWFAPAVKPGKARCGALRTVVKQFFSGSIGDAACALLGQKDAKLTPEEAERLIQLIKESRDK